MTRIGVNANAISRWNEDFPYIDRARFGMVWGLASQNALSGAFEMPAAAIDLIVEWDGIGKIEMKAVGIDGKTVALPATVLNDGTVRFSAPAGPADRAGQIVLRRPGVSVASPPPIAIVDVEEYDAWQRKETLSPKLIAKLKDVGFQTLRNKDLLNTDQMSGWGSMSLEDTIRLANAAGARLWNNLRWDLSDEEAVACMETCARLCDQRSIQEPQNEIWNWGYQASKDIQAWAAGEGMTNADGSGDLYRASGHVFARFGVLARGQQVDVVLGTQPMVPSRATALWKGVYEAGGVDADFYGWMTSMYAAGTTTDPKGPLPALAAAHDIAGAVANIIGKTGDKSEGVSLAAVRKANIEQAKIAKAHGLELVVYEANAHLNVNNFPSAQQPALVAFVEEVQRSPEAEVISAGMLDQCEELGVKEICFFALSAPATKNGDFAVLGTAAEPVVRRAIAAVRPSAEIAALKVQVADLTAERDGLKAENSEMRSVISSLSQRYPATLS